MKIIFENGNRVLNQEAVDFLKQFKQPISSMYQDTWELKSDYEIYGDDFKIEIEGSHGECIFVLKDYDEFQDLEYKTVATFNKQELSQLIAVFTSIKDKM